MTVQGGAALPVALTADRPVLGGPATPVFLTNAYAPGAAFPASPTAGDVFFRTDLGWWCFYDGTRWLTCHEVVYATAAAVSGTTGNTAPVPARTDFAPYLTRVALTRLVLTTNNGSNFWTILVRALNASASAATTLRSQSTAADAANTYTLDDGAPLSAIPANNRGFDVQYTASGSPGTLVAQATIHARLIIP